MNTFLKHCIVLLFLTTTRFVQAQDVQPSSHHVSTPEERIFPSHFHHAAWGVSLASGSPNLGRDGGDAMISMLYAYRYAPTNEVEVSLNYMPVQRLHELDGRVFPDSSGYVSLSFVGDVSFMFQPFSGIFRGLRLGIGPTVPIQSFVRSNAGRSAWQGGQIFNVDSNGVRTPVPIITIPAYPYTQRAEGLSIGANVKVEYLIAVSHNLELCLRAQMQAFLPTNLVSTDGVGVGIGGNVGSIGGMLRVGW
jgi:hypothetical protein